MKKILTISVIALMVLTPILALSAKYDVIMRKYTKSGRIFNVDNFDAKLIWKTTFFSDEFRKVYDKKHVELYHLEPSQAAQYEAEQNHEQSQAWKFFMGMYTKRAYRKFSTERDTFWKIFVTTESGEKIQPISIEMLPISPYEKIMFPYLTRWSKAYQVTFPKIDFGSKFTLTLQSIEGESVLKWHIW